MNTIVKGPGRTSMLVLVYLLSIVGIGCSDTPVGVAPAEPSASPPASETADGATLQRLGIDPADLNGLDVAALSRAVDLNAVAEALQEMGLEGQPAANKHRHVHIVESAQSIQAAIDAAPPYGVIVVRPGLYREALLIEKPLLLVGSPGRGAQKVVIENPGGVSNGITIQDTENVTLANLTVRGFDNNGVFALRLNGFLMLRLEAIDNGAYGLFPVRSSNGLLAFCTATGSADAGLYVGQSDNVAIVNSTAYGNVIGIEIENAVRVAVAHNRSYGNTAGMLAVLLPPSRFITFLEAAELLIAHNRFTENNLENFAPEGFAAVVPSGSGLLVVGYNETRVAHNLVMDNQFVGIGVGSTATFGALAGIEITEIEPDPDGVQVIRNVVKRNGTAASPLPGFTPADLLWDGTGTGNCWERNVYDTSSPPILPTCEAPI